MPSKPKPTSSLQDIGLARKGAATVSGDLPQRGAPSAPPAAAPSAKRAHNASSEPLVPLNFRVPESFREAFESYAIDSRPRRKMVDVLKAAFQALQEKEGRG